jgi:hypothetical protein
MDSVNQAVSMSNAIDQAQTAQAIQMTLLKKVLTSQSDVINTLMQSAAKQVAKDAQLGGMVNTIA